MESVLTWTRGPALALSSSAIGGGNETSASDLVAVNTDADRDLIRRELDRILESSHFKTASRAPVLLRHIVECTITGRTDQLKERILGIEVFGRHPDYDTSLDPVVRVTASRIRQRLARYYAESDTTSQVHIYLPSGSYLAEFRASHDYNTTSTVAAIEANASPIAPRPHSRLALERAPVRIILLSAFAALAVVAAIRIVSAGRNDVLDKFWAPVLESATPVTVCVGYGVSPESAQTTEPLTINEQRRRDSIIWPDAVTLARVGELLASRGKNPLLRRGNSTSLTDLRGGPAVLIGAYNNDWAMRFTPELRFRFQRDDAASMLWISDSRNPSKRDWKLIKSALFSDYREDFGVITRILNPITERTVIVIGGLGSYGTLAGGEFVTNPKYLEDFAQRAGAGWERKNLQVVFATTVIGSSSGPPRVLAVHMW